MEGLLILAALCVAFSNDANDNFKVDHPCLGRSDRRGWGGSQDHRLGDGARHRFVMGRHLAGSGGCCSRCCVGPARVPRVTNR